MLQTPLLGMKLPDRMYVEVLSKYFEKRIAQAERRFLVIDFPGNENQAAILEEDVSCPFTPLRFTVMTIQWQASFIRAFVYLEGKRPEHTSEEAWEESIAASRPLFEKLSGAGRAFKVGGRLPALDSSPLRYDADQCRPRSSSSHGRHRRCRQSPQVDVFGG